MALALLLLTLLYPGGPKAHLTAALSSAPCDCFTIALLPGTSPWPRWSRESANLLRQIAATAVTARQRLGPLRPDFPPLYLYEHPPVGSLLPERGPTPTVPAEISRWLDEIRHTSPTGCPLIILGHSFGAVAAITTIQWRDEAPRSSSYCGTLTFDPALNGFPGAGFVRLLPWLEHFDRTAVDLLPESPMNRLAARGPAPGEIRVRRRGRAPSVVLEWWQESTEVPSHSLNRHPEELGFVEDQRGRRVLAHTLLDLMLSCPCEDHGEPLGPRR